MLEKMIEMFEQLLEKEPGSITGKDEFREYDRWDSLSYLSVITYVDDNYDYVIPLDDFAQFKTVEDIAKYLEERVN